MNLADYFQWADGWPLLLGVPLLLRLDSEHDQRREDRVAQALGPRVGSLARSVDGKRRRFIRRAAILGALCAIVSLLRPAFGDARPIENDRGVDILICLDVSRSMLAQDMAPSRLDFAKAEIRALVDRAAGDRIGLIVFAGEALLMAPLTRDGEAINAMLDEVSPFSVERGGTDIGAALDRALLALKNAEGSYETILLLTDGEDLEGRGQKLAVSCKDKNIVVHALGLGTSGGSKIAVAVADSQRFLVDNDGREVRSVMDTKGLRTITAITGGTFLSGEGQTWALVGLYEQQIVPMAKNALSEGEPEDKAERFQWPLLMALLFWLIDLGSSARRKP